MVQINKLAEDLEKKLNLTQPEPEQEEYLLNTDEEETVFNNEIQKQKSFIAWKMKDKGAQEWEVKANLAAKDWETIIDKPALFKKANESKIHANWVEDQRLKEAEQERKNKELLIKRCNAGYFYNLMKWNCENVYGKKFLVTDSTLPLIKTICMFISRDERFETELGLSLKKGLLIRGISGLGKTFLLKCVENNELNPIHILSVIDITERIKANGEADINPQGRLLYLDDVGTEQPVVNHYGTKIAFFKDFIEMYYLKNNIHNRLIISTNCSFSDIEEKYGFRVRSRCKDMFNVIDVTGTDLRGTQK